MRIHMLALGERRSQDLNRSLDLSGDHWPLHHCSTYHEAGLNTCSALKSHTMASKSPPLPCRTSLRGEEEPGWPGSAEVYIVSRASGRPDSEARGSPGTADTAGWQAQQRILSPRQAAGASPGRKSTQARGGRLQDCALKSEHATAGLYVVSDPADASSFLQTSREHLRRRAGVEAADGRRSPLREKVEVKMPEGASCVSSF